MTTADLAAQILEDPAALEALVASLDDAAAAELVEHFKSEADRHWWINANRSLEFAELIIRIGRQRNDLRHTALGTMARGDALKYLGNLQEAWDELERAGQMFTEAGDEVGWARTRIGKLLLCFNLDRSCIDAALSDTSMARNIFIQNDEHEKLVRLDLNLGVVLYQLGSYQKSIDTYENTLHLILLLNKSSSIPDGTLNAWAGLIHNNLGNVYDAIGKLPQAISQYKTSHDIFVRLGQIRGVALSNFNTAHILLFQGHYKKALNLLYQSRDLYVSDNSLLDAIHVEQDIVECYLLLNRYIDAENLSSILVNKYRDLKSFYNEGLMLIHQASAEAWLGKMEDAKHALDRAELVFQSIGAHNWISKIYLLRARIFLRQESLQEAFKATLVAATFFERNGQIAANAEAILLKGQILAAMGCTSAAKAASIPALSIARTNNLPALRYTAHLLLGSIAEQTMNYSLALRHYNIAITTVERVQRDLTITLRTGFLQDKGEALRRSICLHLHMNAAKQAFEALERSKSQTLLGYLANNNQLRWPQNDPQSKELIEDLNRLREEHYWFYRQANKGHNGEDELPNKIEPEQARAEVVSREKHMRAITEQLYLQGGDSVVQVKVPALEDVQSALAEGELLIEFYNDGTGMWVFTIDRHTFETMRLISTSGIIDGLLTQLQSNIDFALDAAPQSSVARRLSGVAQRILSQLHNVLLAPIHERIRGRQRLIVVPYGSLHYLPFHLLHDGIAYLLEQYELLVLPAAGLLTRRGPVQPAGVRVLAHSWQGRLPHTEAESELVIETLGGFAYSEENARREALANEPTQILHISAHGEHRLDQPDLSFIELADGQLYTDDLLQLDMSYELVVLSACETGKAKVTAGDELIGLGRGFLYAGAGALVASLWRVTDTTTLVLMQHFYAGLRAGMSKAAALRNAQLAILAEQPDLHPAFWGAFQLVGDARPLTGFADEIQMDEDIYPLMPADLN